MSAELMWTERKAILALQGPVPNAIPKHEWQPRLLNPSQDNNLRGLALPAVSLLVAQRQAVDFQPISPLLGGAVTGTIAFLWEQFLDKEKGGNKISESIGNAVFGFVLGAGLTESYNDIRQAQEVDKFWEVCQSSGLLAGEYLLATKEWVKQLIKNAIVKTASAPIKAIQESSKNSSYMAHAIEIKKAAKTFSQKQGLAANEALETLNKYGIPENLAYQFSKMDESEIAKRIQMADKKQ